MTGGRVQAVDVFGSETMNINMNDVAKQLIENNNDPISSFEKLTDEEVLQRLIQNNQDCLLQQFTTGFLLDIYNHLFQLLTVDCLIFIRHPLYPVEWNKVGVKEYLYEVEWNYQKEKAVIDFDAELDDDDWEADLPDDD